MSKSFKSEIKKRYEGRGNTWVKVPKDHVVYNDIINLISKFKKEETQKFISDIEREGYGWIRFSKPSGNLNNKLHVFEVRFRGAKHDHKDCTLEVKDSIAQTLPLLGNTPVKLHLENPEKKNKAAVIKKKEVKKSTSFNKEEVIEYKIVPVAVQESKLTTPTLKELKEWKDFLKAEGLYSGEEESSYL